MNLHQVIKSAVNTEKSVNAQGENKYTFIVHNDASKEDISKAVEEFWGVKVDSVRIIKMPMKYRISRFRTLQPKRLKKKKAIVKLKAGEKLELLKFAKVETSK
jgi:large subunit ribosomal protein L23